MNHVVTCDECGTRIESDRYPIGWLKSGSEDVCLNCRLDAIERILLGKQDAERAVSTGESK